MRGAVSLEQAIGVDAGIDLRRRGRGVSEQFLDGAQVAAASQQVCRERVSQRVRSRGWRQPERTAELRDPQLNDARREDAALHAAEERHAGIKLERAEAQVGL